MENIINFFNNLMQISFIEIIFKLILVTILAGMVGYERSFWNKPAGFRTHVLVGISSVLVMLCGEHIYNLTGADPSRIPAQLLSGIGFLGAGTILRDGFNVKGLTTAAGLLAVTCIGLTVGAGYYLAAILATIFVYIVLSNSHSFSDTLEKEHNSLLKVNVVTSKPKVAISQIREFLEDYDVAIEKLKIIDDEEIRVMLKIKADINPNTLIAGIVALDSVKEIEEL